MKLRKCPLVLCATALLVVAMTACSHPGEPSPNAANQAPAPVVTDPAAVPTSQPKPPSPEAALEQLKLRVNQIAEFTFEGFVRKGTPRSQIATVPPVWTGEKLRGEKAGNKLGEGAILLFASPADETLIVVDVAYVEGLSGRGILRTAWIDEEIAEKAGTCSGCTGHSVIQFYEPGLVYTVTAMKTDGRETYLYRFTEALMQYLR